ncbi:MAG: hypothetical protein AAB922_06455 [Patescibacteria group bacterium]
MTWKLTPARKAAIDKLKNFRYGRAIKELPEGFKPKEPVHKKLYRERFVVQ